MAVVLAGLKKLILLVVALPYVVGSAVLAAALAATYFVVISAVGLAVLGIIGLGIYLLFLA